MKEDGRKLSKEQQVEARRRAVLLLKRGWHEGDIAEAVGVHERTVRQWKAHQRDHGTEALLRDERGRRPGQGRRLTAAQEQQVRRLIADRLPEQLKLPFALWTRRAVAGLLEQRFGLKLPVRTMGLYLKRWGFTPQKPLKKAYEQNPKKVKAWLEREYPQIAASAKREGAEIYWGDQTGVNNQPNAPRGYAPRGQTPVVRQMARRLGSSVMSAVSNRGSARWMVYRGGAGRAASHQVPGAAGALDEGTQGVSHPRQPQGSSQQAGESLAGGAPGADRRASPAQLQSRTQPR